MLRLRQLASVRVRTTIGAVLVVGVAVTVGAVALVVLLHVTLTRQIRTAAELRAMDVAAVLSAGARPGTFAVDVSDEMLIQVVDDSGKVVVSSPNVEGRPPVARLKPGESAEVTVSLEDDPGGVDQGETDQGGVDQADVDRGSFLAVAAAADTPGGRLTVIAARASETVGESVRTVALLLAVGLPLLLLLVAVTTWKVIGRALAPVEAIRREVDAISAAELHRRVPDPQVDDEIARLARTMNRMLGRLQRAHERQRRFISDASHELRSPVAAIRQHAEVALAHPDRTTTAELAGTVLAEDLRVQRLVEDLLLLARADEHTLRLRRRPLDLDDLVFDEARRLRTTTGLRVDTTGVSAARVDGDAIGLGRVLRNLGDNAARHARSRISFVLSERDGAAVLMVDDDGRGIPAADRERVLERFVRLDEARARDEGGSGLGLAIVAELVAAHGGAVTIGGSSLGGARVEISLPRTPDG